MAITLPKDFKEFLRLLKDHRVEYLLIGGYAVALHGFPRYTGDLDVWIGATPENARRLVGALKAFGFPAEGLTAESLTERHRILRMGHQPLRIEIHNEISGVEFGECYPRRSTLVIDEVEVDLISKDDLKQNKKASGRLRDLADIENLSQD